MTKPPIKLPIRFNTVGVLVDAYVIRAANSHEALIAACNLVLLFHSGGPWHSDRVIAWSNGLTTIRAALALAEKDL